MIYGTLHYGREKHFVTRGSTTVKSNEGDYLLFNLWTDDSLDLVTPTSRGDVVYLCLRSCGYRICCCTTGKDW